MPEPLLVWYNRPRKFDNGIVWFRIRHHGPGLWWMDTRAPGHQPPLYSTRRFARRIGPFYVKFLRRDHAPTPTVVRSTREERPR